MSITTTSDLSNSVTTRYEKEYILQGDFNPGIWAQFVDWQPPISTSGGGGSSYDFPIYDEGTPLESALTENADVTPQTIDDGNMTVTPTEWGGTFSTTKKLQYMSRTNVPEIMAKKNAAQRVLTIDRFLRRAVCGRGATYPTNTYFPGTDNTTMLLCTGASSADCVDYEFLMELNAYAASMGIEPWKDSGYVCPIHPTVAFDILSLTEFKTMGYYQPGEKNNIYAPWGRPFTLANITFIPTPRGRLHLGSGAAVRTATTLSAAVSKGATSVVAAADESWSVGDYITLGTKETESVNPGDNLEQMLVTGVSTTTLTVRGDGANNNFGCRFDHAIGEAITTAYNVASLPILGKNSVIGIYGSDVGPYGKAITKLGTLDLLDRFSYFGWYWYGGVAPVQKKVVLGRAAVSKFVLGWN
jgi:hypothetical protein